MAALIVRPQTDRAGVGRWMGNAHSVTMHGPRVDLERIVPNTRSGVGVLEMMNEGSRTFAATARTCARTPGGRPMGHTLNLTGATASRGRCEHCGRPSGDQHTVSGSSPSQRRKVQMCRIVNRVDARDGAKQW